MTNTSLYGSVSKEKEVLAWKKSSSSKPLSSLSLMESCWHFWQLKRDLYSMKIKEQTRKLAAGCTWVRQGEADVVWIDFRRVLPGIGFWFTVVGSFSFILFYWPIFPPNFVTTSVNSIPRLDRDSGVLPYKSSSGIAWSFSLCCF